MTIPNNFSSELTPPAKPLRIVFFGTPEFAVTILRALCELKGIEVVLCVTQPDTPQGRGKKITPSPVKAYATAQGIPIYQPQRLKSDRNEVEKTLGNFEPFDGAVVVAFGQILPKWLLELFNSRCVNVHASLLPQLRGAAPIIRAILEGHTQTGICLMKMEEGLDSGPVYKCAAIPVTSTTTGGELHDALAELGSALIKDWIQDILRGDVIAKPQDENNASYAAKISSTDRIIDWKLSADQIERTIRAFAPSPCAVSEVVLNTSKLERIKIGEARVSNFNETSPYLSSPPGTIISVNGDSLGDGLVVRCGVGCLVLTRLQRSGRLMNNWNEIKKSGIFQLGMQFHIN